MNFMGLRLESREYFNRITVPLFGIAVFCGLLAVNTLLVQHFFYGGVKWNEPATIPFGTIILINIPLLLLYGCWMWYRDLYSKWRLKEYR